LPDVAILGSPGTSSWNDDVQAKLLATGQFASVDVFNIASTTPSLAQIQQYCAVLVYTDGPNSADPAALGDNLADYVDLGGGLVAAVFATASIPLQGRFNADDYWAIQPTDQQQGPPESLGTIFDPGHPILAGVTSFAGGSASYRPSLDNVHPSATRIANWTGSGSIPLIATRVIGGTPRADLGFFPPSDDARSDFWDASTDGALIIANALTWVCSFCGNGTTESGEDCDDGGESATCDGDCTLASCGDGTVNATAGEECDDANAAAEDGCDDICIVEPGYECLTPGEACQDIDGCDPDPCQNGGACSDVPAPGTGALCDCAGTGFGGVDCSVPIDCPPSIDFGCTTGFEKISLQVKETVPGKEKLVAKMVRGPQLAQTDMGDPLGGDTVFSFCVYDGTNTLVGEMIVDRAGDSCSGKPCWKSVGKAPPAGKGYKYKDNDAGADGVQKVQYKGGDAGKSKVLVKGRGPNLPSGMAVALQGSAFASVQLRASDGICLSGSVDEVSKQESDFFKAKGDASSGPPTPTATSTHTNTPTNTPTSTPTATPTETPTPACVATQPGILAWWPGNGNSNDVVAGRDGILQGDATYATGKVGQAFSFDGDGDYVEIADDPAWELGTGPFTIETWVRFDARADSGTYSLPTIVGQRPGPGSSGGPSWTLSYSDNPAIFDDELFFEIINPNGSPMTILQTAWDPIVGTWYHVAVTRDVTNAYRLYVDGNLIAGPVINTTAMPDSPAPLQIGWNEGSFSPENYLNGAIDELTIYTSALDGTALQDIVDAGADGKCQ
jgi:cysteine-rich repeat protein